MISLPCEHLPCVGWTTEAHGRVWHLFGSLQSHASPAIEDFLCNAGDVEGHYEPTQQLVGRQWLLQLHGINLVVS